MKKILFLFLFSFYLVNSATAQNVGIGTNTPSAKLTVNGNLALLSDTVKISCDIMAPKMIIDNIAKPRSVFHIINEGCGALALPPIIAGLSGGSDGKMVTIISHVDNMQIQHLQANTAIPSAADSMNMIELYEPNSNGPINQPYAYTFNNGGSISLIYDGRQKKWKPLNYYGDVKADTYGWYKGSNPNDIYNPNAGNVGIGTGSPLQKLDVAGNAKVRNNLLVDGNIGIGVSNPAIPISIQKDNFGYQQSNVGGSVILGLFTSPGASGNEAFIGTLTSSTLRLGTNSVPNINILPSGNVGIGTTTPLYPLSVKSNGVGISQESPDGNTKVGFYVANGSAYLQTHTNHPLRFTTNNGQEQMRLQTDGNLGIGTTSPNASLSVARGTGTDGTAAFFGTTNTSHFNYSTNEDTYIRGGKIGSKVFINDYGGQVAIGTTSTGTAQLNVVSSRTGAAANGISVLQTTTNTGQDSYGINLNVNGSNLNNFGLKSEVGNSAGLNLAGLFQALGVTTGSNKGIVAKANNSLASNIGGQFEAVAGSNVSQNYGVYTTATGFGPNYGIYCAGSGAFGQQIGTPNYGIFAVGPGNPINGYAGFFDGAVFVSGVLSKSGGSFQIDHPQDPANKYLYHSFVESPDMMNIYNNNITTDNSGMAIVQLPDYFVTLNKDFRYQLTVIGQFAQAIIFEKVNNNRFTIKTDKPNVEVSWQVTGIRQDAWANAHRIIPEVEKEEKNKGKYLTPEVFGQPKEKGIHYVKPLNTENR